MESTLLAFTIVFWTVTFLIYIIWAFFVGEYARRLGRGETSWFLFAFFLSPIFAIIVLFMKGETDEHRKARIIEEEIWRRSCNNTEITPNTDIIHENDVMNVLTNR